MYDLLIIGGGAAGFFTAINCAEEHPKLKDKAYMFISKLC